VQIAEEFFDVLDDFVIRFKLKFRGYSLTNLGSGSRILFKRSENLGGDWIQKMSITGADTEDYEFFFPSFPYE